ncbi:MAG: TonB-dependent receptor plug domain-containing protein [Odoribacter sp.]|nr:TonB-dependent receptor plug domain-containing protein [Odoribacter sp.]
MMKIFIKYILMCCLLFISIIDLMAQNDVTVTGRVYKATNQEAIENVQVFSVGTYRSVITDSTGRFTIVVNSPDAWLRFNIAGYQEKYIFLNGRIEVNVFLTEENQFMYNSVYNTSEGVENRERKMGNSVYLKQKDLGYGHAQPDNSLVGRIAGLKVTPKSGMPGEGSLVQLRGLRSLSAENTPLIVLGGLPYLPDLENSAVIKGYSRSIFAPVNMKDVESITLLKGIEAASYGSLGSNGVIMIETERSQATRTEVKAHFTEGIGFMKRRFPLLGVSDFKNYIADIGDGLYPDLNELVALFPFLKDDPSYPGYYLYTSDTDWQDEIYTPSIVSENNLKIMGGDAVASYALSVGYLYDKGILKNTHQSKYNTRLNADVHVTKNFLLYANAAFNYSQNDLMETGLNFETNPILTALNQSPLLSVYAQNTAGENLPSYNKTVNLFGISNPVAIVNTLEAKNRTYDILVNLGFKYNVLPSLKVNGMIGLYYSYSKDNFFAPGLTSGAIAFLTEGIEANTMRVGIGETLNYYLKFSADYDKTFNNVHQFNSTLGYQLISSRKEMDWSNGLSIQSDFYTSLRNVDGAYQRHIGGYNDKWNWIDVYLTAKYGYKGQYYAGATLTMDAASSYGKVQVGQNFFRQLNYPG